jgi:L-aspartate oxidase
LGYDLPFERVPVSPAFHYSMGGVETTLDAKIKGMKNLYAIGEVACTGVHGANRLASNSLLEGLVFSQIAVEDSLKNNFKITKESYDKPIINYIRNQEIDKDIKDDLREMMWTNASIVRNTKNLEMTLEKIEGYLKLNVGRLLFLRLLTAKAILKSALQRKESLGAHYLENN